MMAFCKHRVMDRCKKDGKPCIFSKECFEPEEEKPKTNADHIRSMTDEELAEILVIEKEYGVAHIVYYECPDGMQFDEGQYKQALQYTIDWLKQHDFENQIGGIHHENQTGPRS